MLTISFIFTEFLPTAAREIGETFSDVLKSDCDERRNHSVSLSHFHPFTRFENGVDLSNGDLYWRDNPKVTRLKCLALLAATPIIHAIGLVLNLANRIA